MYPDEFSASGVVLVLPACAIGSPHQLKWQVLDTRKKISDLGFRTSLLGNINTFKHMVYRGLGIWSKWESMLIGSIRFIRVTSPVFSKPQHTKAAQCYPVAPSHQKRPAWNCTCRWCWDPGQEVFLHESAAHDGNRWACTLSCFLTLCP